MNNLKIRKKLIALAMANTFILSGIPANISYAESNTVETVDVKEFENIHDIVVAKDKLVAIKDKMGGGYSLLGTLEPGEYLKLIADCESNYEVLYKGKIAYVNKNYVYESTLDDYFNSVDSKDIVVAKSLTEIKKINSDDSETIGTLKEKESLKVNDKKDGYYEVMYKDGLAYVDMAKVEYKKIFEKSAYATKECDIYKTKDFDSKLCTIKELEFVKIYDETENAYYVEVNNNMGYISKDYVELIEDKYIVVDISNQIVEMYNDNELLLSTSVVTGKPSKHPTPTGVYYIGDEKNEVTDHRDLVGEGYRSRVTYMITFIGKRGIGFHDSEIGIDDRGVHHGWRVDSEYGGDTYITDGSHGCVNMPNDAAKEMYDIVYPYVVEQGNLVKVLVKE